jgi:hypothetical protein
MLLENFETVNIQQTNGKQVGQFFSGLEDDVDFRNQPVEHAFVECLRQRMTGVARLLVLN